MSGLKCIGIVFEVNGQYFGDEKERNVFYFNYKDKTFHRGATNCWFHESKANEAYTNLMLAMFDTDSFKNFTTELFS